MSARLKGLLILGITLLLVFSFWGIKRSLRRLSYFSLRQVEIKSGPRLSKEEIIRLAGVHLGENLFALRLEMIRKRLEAHPWVARAFVSRKLPHILFIEIEEEEPVAMVSSGKEVYLVNVRGRLFAKAPPELMKELPALSGLRPEEIEAKELAPARLEILRLLARLKKEQKLVPCFVNISQVKFVEDGFWLLTRDAIRVRFSGQVLKDYLAAYRKLDRIFGYLYQTDQYQRAKVIRLDYPPKTAALALREG